MRSFHSVDARNWALGNNIDLRVKFYRCILWSKEPVGSADVYLKVSFLEKFPSFCPPFITRGQK